MSDRIPKAELEAIIASDYSSLCEGRLAARLLAVDYGEWLPDPDGPGDWWVFPNNMRKKPIFQKVFERREGRLAIQLSDGSLQHTSYYSGPWQRAIVPEKPS